MEKVKKSTKKLIQRLAKPLKNGKETKEELDYLIRTLPYGVDNLLQYRAFWDHFRPVPLISNPI